MDWASMVFPVPGSPLMRSGFWSAAAMVDTANELWRGNIRITSLELFHKVSFSGPLLT